MRRFAIIIVTASALAAPRTSAQAQVNGPEIFSGGIVNAANYNKDTPVSPGSIFSIFGANFGDRTASPVAFYAPDGHEIVCLGTCGPYTVPADWFLPNDYASLGVGVWINGIAAPIFYISPKQLNVQFPTELAGASSVTVQVVLAADPPDDPIISHQAAVSIPLSSFSPGIFTLDQNGSGPGAILRASDFSKICPSGRSDCTVNRAHPGEAVAIYATGLGAVMGPMPSGRPAVSALQTVTTPRVTIGGIMATVLYSGLAPGFVGLYQVNVVVPESVSEGDSIPLTMTIGGNDSNSVTIAIQ